MKVGPIIKVISNWRTWYTGDTQSGMDSGEEFDAYEIGKFGVKKIVAGEGKSATVYNQDGTSVELFNVNTIFRAAPEQQQEAKQQEKEETKSEILEPISHLMMSVGLFERLRKNIILSKGCSAYEAGEYNMIEVEDISQKNNWDINKLGKKRLQEYNELLEEARGKIRGIWTNKN